MLDIFGTNTLARCFYPEDFFQNPRLSTNDYRREFLDDALELTNTKGFFSGNIDQKELNKKPIYIISCLKRKLLLRQCSKNIKHGFSVTPPDRHKPISFLVDFLSQNIPIVIHKIDIKSFFESCDFRSILENQVKESGFNDSYNILSDLCDEFQKIGGKGLPRGVAVSSILSEIFMQDFDEKIAALEGVLYFHRYVDDIIIISNGKHRKEISKKINILLSEKNLSTNPGKCTSIDLTENSRRLRETSENKYSDSAVFDFLGYKIQINTELKRSNKGRLRELEREVSVEISDRKINKLKYKISKSFMEFRKNKDKELLIDRLDFLSTCRKLKNRSGDIPIMTGLAYSYKFVEDPTSLIDVDRYLRSILEGKSGRIGSTISIMLTRGMKDELRKISFYKRFKDRTFKSYSPNRMEEIVSPWK